MHAAGGVFPHTHSLTHNFQRIAGQILLEFRSCCERSYFSFRGFTFNFFWHEALWQLQLPASFALTFFQTRQLTAHFRGHLGGWTACNGSAVKPLANQRTALGVRSNSIEVVSNLFEQGHGVLVIALAFGKCLPHLVAQHLCAGFCRSGCASDRLASLYATTPPLADTVQLLLRCRQNVTLVAITRHSIQHLVDVSFNLSNGLGQQSPPSSFNLIHQPAYNIGAGVCVLVGNSGQRFLALSFGFALRL